MTVRVNMCEVFLVCLVTIAFPALAYIFADPLFGFGKEVGVAVQVSHLRDRSPPLVKVVFHTQIAEDEMMKQSKTLFRVTFQSPCKYLT